MDYSVVMHLVSFVVDLLAVHGQSNEDKDVEILVLRHQVRLLQRKLGHQPRLSPAEKVLFAVLAVRFKASVAGAQSRLEQSLLLFKPETWFKWHRELVARKWTYPAHKRCGATRRVIDVKLRKRHSKL